MGGRSPRLHITHKGERKVEMVNVSYPLSRYDPFTSPGSTATITTLDGTDSYGTSKYIRVWVYNASGITARRCRVYVENVWLDKRPIEAERSLLHWTDLDGMYELSDMSRGYRNGHYVDVCASDSIDHRLQLISQKALKGYHRFSESGVYRCELSAEAEKPCHTAHFVMNIHYDNRDWSGLRVISTTESRAFLHWKG